MRIDFHMHTQISDGVCSPSQLLALIRSAGLAYWAITDHDCTEASQALRDQEGAIAACELTAWDEDDEVHIVALGIDCEHTGLQDFLADIRAARRQRLRQLCRWLTDVHSLAVPEDAGERPGSRVASRSHLAGYLADQGLVSSRTEAFTRWLEDRHLRALPAAAYPSVQEVTTAIHAAGGLAILAHPGRYESLAVVTRILQRGAFDGLESRHQRCSPSWRQDLDRLISQGGLLASCGSDFHFPGHRQVGDPHLSGPAVQPLLSALQDCPGTWLRA